MTQPHALYRFFGSGGTLLYIGITNSIPRRLMQHGGDKDWWTGVANVAVEHYPTREAVLEAERRAIIAEKPLYNDKHNAAGKAWQTTDAGTAAARCSDFLLICQGCRSSITEDWIEGLLHIPHAEIRAAQKEWRAWNKPQSEGGTMLDFGAFHVPRAASWQVHCGMCNPHRDDESGDYCDGCYAIGTTEIQTWRQLVTWTSHLSDKAWLETTDWFDMLGALSRSSADDRFVLASDYLAEVA